MLAVRVVRCVRARSVRCTAPVNMQCTVYCTCEHADRQNCNQRVALSTRVQVKKADLPKELLVKADDEQQHEGYGGRMRQ
jgi:hypothetical protein